MSTEETRPVTYSDIRAMIEEVIRETRSKEAEGFKQTLKEMKEELKEEINKIHGPLNKLIDIVLRTQLAQLNGSSGDGSPAPRSEPNQMQPPPIFSLKFESEVGDSVEKGKSITIKVKMYDGGNPIGEKLKDGRPHPLASAKVMLVVLDGNFNDNRSSWSKADFEKSIKTSTAGDGNQGIVSDCVFYLDGGSGRHSSATITENSGNRKVKLGVMVVPDDSYGEYKNVRVLEGVSKESFLVRDPRRPSKKQKQAQNLSCPTVNTQTAGNRQLQLQAGTNMPSSSSTPRDNTLGADPQRSVEPSTNQQPSSFSEGYHHISAGVQTSVISDSVISDSMIFQHSLDEGVQPWISQFAYHPWISQFANQQLTSDLTNGQDLVGFGQDPYSSSPTFTQAAGNISGQQQLQGYYMPPPCPPPPPYPYPYPCPPPCPPSCPYPCCMPRPCSMPCPIGTPYHKMPRKLLGCHVQNEEYLPLADVKENDNEDAAEEAYDGNSGKDKAEVIKQRLEEQNEELKEAIKEMNKQWKKLKRIVRTQSEQLNGSSGDGYPAPRSEPNQMQPPRFSLKIECEVGDTVERGKSIPVKVDLYDDGNLIATSHPLASAKVMIVVLKRKFNNSRHSWSKVDFEASIVRPRLQNSTIGDVNQGIQSIVNNCVFKLDGGTGRHSGATITENSGNKKVKLGVMVLPDDSYGEYKNERVLEGVSEERFIVREQLDPPRTSKKQKEAVEPFRSPSAEQAPVGCGQERNGPTLNISGQLQLQADTNMPSSSSTPRDNTLGADQQLPVEPSTNRQPSSFSEGHQTPVISDSTNQTMHNPDGDVQMDSVLEDLHQMGNPIEETMELYQRFLEETGTFGMLPSTNLDASGPSFSEMLKSTKKPALQYDASESADGGPGGKGLKKKAKKGKQIDPSLLGFKVHSNRIMMGYFEPQLNNEPIRRVRRDSVHCSSNEGGGGVAKEIDWSSLMSLMICSSHIFDFKDYKLLRVLDLEGCNGLTERVLDVICKLPFLRYPSLRGSDVPRIPKNPKPPVSRVGFSGSSFVVDRDGFPSLQRLCFEPPKLPLLQIEQGGMTKLTSLQMLCQEFADGLGVTGIEHPQRLDEVILHSSASDAVMEHQNRPSVKKQQINDAA